MKIKEYLKKTIPEKLKGFEQALEEIEPKVNDFGIDFDGYEKAVETIGRSWSGSNIGDHANIYYQDFEPPPPNRIFNAMWGLQQNSFQFSPVGWVMVYEPEVVYEEIESLVP